MRGVSPVIATVLLVAVAVAAAVGFYAWTGATMSSTQSTASAQANKVFNLPLTIEAAQMTTPYTWNVIVRNPNSVEVNADELKLYVKDAKGDICAVSSGAVGGDIPAQGVKEITFYGWDSCKIPKSLEEWKLELSAGGYKSEYAVPVSSSSMGLVLWVPFDESSGDYTYDKSGHGVKCQIQSATAPGLWVQGVHGSAFEFNGGGWITCTFPEPLGPMKTYVFWFKLPSTSDTEGTFFCTQDATDAKTQDNLGETVYGDSTGYGTWRYSGFDVNDTNWHMYGIIKPNKLLYLDNNYTSTFTTNTADLSTINPYSTKIVFNGGCGYGYGNFSQGIILDEILIFSKPLDDQTMEALYLLGASK